MGYAARVFAAVKPNIILEEDVAGNPLAEVESASLRTATFSRSSWYGPAVYRRFRDGPAAERLWRPPTLICWGPKDGYMPEESGRAYLRDLPKAELHMLDGGHWLLETHLEQVVQLARDFLGRVHAATA